MKSQMKILMPESYSVGIWKKEYNDWEVRRFLTEKAADITVGRYHWRDVVILEPDDAPLFMFCVSGELYRSEDQLFWYMYGRHLEDEASKIKPLPEPEDEPWYPIKGDLSD